jgi:hypothetical protein
MVKIKAGKSERQEHINDIMIIIDCNCKKLHEGWQKCAKREEYMQVDVNPI